MRSSTFMVSSLAIFGAYAAPALPKLDLDNIKDPAAAVDSLSSYFNLLAAKVKTSKAQTAVPVCDLSKAQMPPLNGLLPPSAGLTLYHVAVGRGTQNYTCDASKPDSAPTAVGAMATLFNVSCMASISQDLLQVVPNMAVNFELAAPAGLPTPAGTPAGPLGPMTLPVSGHHFFLDSTTPFFNLDTPDMDLGTVPCAKNSSTPAPATAAQGPQGSTAVPWLRLTAKAGATGNIKEVYRINTAGGNPPATCQGQPATIQVQYSAVYWFWGSN